MKLFDRFVVGLLPAVPRKLVWRFSRPYVAGESLDDALRAVQTLNARGAKATLDLLGESITRREEAEAARDAYLDMLERIARTSLDTNVSLKLTQLGLKLDAKFCLDNVRAVVDAAARRRNFVRIDMEDSSCTDATLTVFRALQRDHDNVGIVLQAYLRRSLDDARELGRIKANVRLCKGIYVEAEAIAYKQSDEIRASYMAIVEELFKAGSYLGVATHDDVLAERTWELAQKLKLTPQQYEFQMLYGVRPGLGQSLLGRGARLRVYVPYGRQWYPYCMRRLRENPAVAGYVLKNLFVR